MAPILRALPAALRGEIHTDHPGALAELAAHKGPVLTASHADMVKVRHRLRRPIVLMDHGAGQTYGAGDGYADSGDKRGCALYLAPGPHALAEHNRRHVGVPGVCIGFPLREEYAALRAGRQPNPTPVVALGWHWDCRVTEATKATWPWWLQAACTLQGVHVLGHGHPREWGKLAPKYAELGVEATPYFWEVIKRADLLLVDNSSIAFEALAVGLPVLLLDSPDYQYNGALRFGDVGRMFPRCCEPEQLQERVDMMLRSADPMPRREEILSAVYFPEEGGAEVAARVLESTESLWPWRVQDALS